MGRGGRNGGSRNPANLPRAQQVSRKVSWLLRHGASQEGLSLGKGGYVNVEDALNTKTLKSLNITFSELREVVSSNDKQRFSMVLASSLEEAILPTVASSAQEKLKAEVFDPVPPSENPSDYLIRANQGHSIKIDTEGLLVPIIEAGGNVPDIVVHGTDEQAWKLILKSGGLHCMGRNHIHFASGLPRGFKPINSIPRPTEEVEGVPVISGMRKSSSILIYIDISAALAADIKFYISENGVILTEGNEKGFLPYTFFKRVERRKSGGSVLMSGGNLPDGAIVNTEEWKQEVGDVKGKRTNKGRSSSGKAQIVDDSRDMMAGLEQ